MSFYIFFFASQLGVQRARVPMVEFFLSRWSRGYGSLLEARTLSTLQKTTQIFNFEYFISEFYFCTKTHDNDFVLKWKTHPADMEKHEFNDRRREIFLLLCTSKGYMKRRCDSILFASDEMSRRKKCSSHK